MGGEGVVTYWDSLWNGSKSVKIFADKILLVKQHLAMEQPTSTLPGQFIF
jgi:hypothetical protein